MKKGLKMQDTFKNLRSYKHFSIFESKLFIFFLFNFVKKKLKKNILPSNFLKSLKLFKFYIEIMQPDLHISINVTQS